MTSTNLTRRTRDVTRTRTEAITRNGRTSYVEIPYTVSVPVPPRDWDHIVLTGVTAAAGLVVAGSVAWSTGSIGDLLSRAAHPGIAYTAAAAFDLAWITALAVEWLARHDPRKTRLPRIAGYVALAVAMAAICTHGALQGGHGAYAVGIIGALVSALAKGMWTMVLGHHAQPLDIVSQQWVDQQLAEAGAEFALATVDRKLARVRGQVADYQAAYAAEIEPAHRDAERAAEYARSIMPSASEDEIDAQLAAAGLRQDGHGPVTSPVMSPVTWSPQDDHRPDRRMTTVPAGEPTRQMVTSVVTPAEKLTGAQQLAAARRLNTEALKGKPSRPVTIETLQVELGLSRRDAADLRSRIIGR